MSNYVKTKCKFRIYSQCPPFSAIRIVAATLFLGVFASSAQTIIFLFTGVETNITLSPGTYNITAYGDQGGGGCPNQHFPNTVADVFA
jgi:hypothetical protein